MEPIEPIPLRTLTVLLNYERMISDTRFPNACILDTSTVDPGLTQRLMMLYPSQFIPGPATIERTDCHLLGAYSESLDFEHPRTTCDIHPDADPDTRALSFAWRELIYHVMHGHNGCFEAIGLYQFFFSLCPPDQTVSIQIADEKPVIVRTSAGYILNFLIKGPKLRSMFWNFATRMHMYTGVREDELHSVLLFTRPEVDKETFPVVDMTRMQYGEAGRGTYGENYFLGTLEKFLSSMKRVCGTAALTFMDRETLIRGICPTKEIEERLKACAERAWRRWLRRNEEGWCDHCGKGGQELFRCEACKVKVVRYCCKEHQQAGWGLHKFCCEGVVA